jgi:hypothetical protein
MRIGISGHQRLKDPAWWEWVRREMLNLMAPLPRPLTGITSLAIGADQLFAEIILQSGGCLEVILPFRGYKKKFNVGNERRAYQRLLMKALRLEVLKKEGSDEEAYWAAGKRVVDLSELFITVWDGRPAAGLGGTADVVNYALQKRRHILHLNPVLRTVTRRV